MQITAADFPKVRRLEAVSFRSFPATTTHFNGTWAIHLTACHPAKRLNSVSPLDPEDGGQIETRLAQEIDRFRIFGRPVTFRTTPLAPAQLIRHLDELGWEIFEETMVMQLDLLDHDLGFKLDQATDLLPFSDITRWVDAFLKMDGESGKQDRGLVEIIESIGFRAGLFLHENKDFQPISALRAVINDDLVGLFDVITDINSQRQGLAASLIYSALRWARFRGAKMAWLQVATANRSAIALYKLIGFTQFYRYQYRRP